MPEIEDSEVQLLAGCSITLREQHPDREAIWKGSPFAWIEKRPSRQKGAIAEKLISGYLALKGFDIIRSPDTEADRIIANKRAEIKTSFLWGNQTYKFQQLRDQNYDFALCLGISPFDACCWVIPKQIIMEKWRSGEIIPQHGGSSGTDTAWFSVAPQSPPEWIDEWGGRLAEAVEKIIEITGQKPLP